MVPKMCYAEPKGSVLSLKNLKDFVRFMRIFFIQINTISIENYCFFFLNHCNK